MQELANKHGITRQGVSCIVRGWARTRDCDYYRIYPEHTRVQPTQSTETPFATISLTSSVSSRIRYRNKWVYDDTGEVKRAENCAKAYMKWKAHRFAIKNELLEKALANGEFWVGRCL